MALAMARRKAGYARDAVSRLLQGENIDFYLAASLDISVLNDLAGGVTVTLEDDFSAADPQAMTKELP